MHEITHDDQTGGSSELRVPRDDASSTLTSSTSWRPDLTALGIILVRVWIAEGDQHPVTHVFGNKAAEAMDRFGYALLIGRDQFA